MESDMSMKDTYESLTPEQQRYIEAVWHIFDGEPVDLSSIQDRCMMKEELERINNGK